MRSKERFLNQMSVIDFDEDAELPKIQLPLNIDIPSLIEQTKEELKRLQLSQCIISHAIMGDYQSRLHKRLNHVENWDDLLELDRMKYRKLFKWLHYPDKIKYKVLRDYWQNKTELDFPLVKIIQKRPTFTPEQTSRLTRLFANTFAPGYPTPEEMQQLSRELNLPLPRVRQFMKNKRNRDRTAARRLAQRNQK